MIRLIYKLFAKRFNALVFEDQKIYKDWRDECQVHYIDTDGNRYWTPKNIFNNLTVKRREYLENLIALNDAGFSRQDKDEWIKNTQGIISGIIKDVEKRGNISLEYLFEELARLKSMVKLMDERFKVIIEPDVLLSMMAVILIRDDEDPAVISDKIVDLKVEQFKKDDKLRNAPFFLNSGLDQFMPFLNNLEENWEQFIQTEMRKKELIRDGEKKILAKEFSKG